MKTNPSKNPNFLSRIMRKLNPFYGFNSFKNIEISLEEFMCKPTDATTKKCPASEASHEELYVPELGNVRA